MGTKEFSSKQETKVACFLGWDVVSGSGARDCHPGDIMSDDWLGECKTHEKPGHTIVFWLKVWDKICEEAMAKHRYPLLIVDDGSQNLCKTWVMFNVRTAGILNKTELDLTDKLLKTTSVTLKQPDEDWLRNLLKSNHRVVPTCKLKSGVVGILPLYSFETLVLSKGL